MSTQSPPSSRNIILYTGAFELPDRNAAAQRVMGNAKALRDLGYEVVFIDLNRQGTAADILSTVHDSGGFSCYSVRDSARRLYSIGDTRKVYGIYADRVCAVIAYDYPAVALNRLRHFCHEHTIKLLGDCTEWYLVKGGNPAYHVAKVFDTWYRMTAVQKRLDGLIVISRYLEDYYKPYVPLVRIPPLVDLSDAKWKQERIAHDGITLIYAGTTGRDKDKLNEVIRALYRIGRPDVRFQVVGLTRDDYLALYPDDDKYLTPQIEFFGRQPHTEVIHMLINADFSIFYRAVNRVTMAGFPTKFVESISAGTPVITSQTSDLSDYLVDGVNGYWLAEDIYASLNGILSRNVDDLKAMRGNVEKETFGYADTKGTTLSKFVNRVVSD